MSAETKSHTRMTWAARHANMLLGIGGTIGAGLLAWLFNTVNNIENELIYMNTKQEPLYAELLHHQDEVERLRIRVLAQEQAMRILGYPVPEVITDDAAKERARAVALEQKLKEAEAIKNEPFWADFFAREETVDQSSEVDEKEQKNAPVTIPTPPVDKERVRRYMEQMQQIRQHDSK